VDPKSVEKTQRTVKAIDVKPELDSYLHPAEKEVKKADGAKKVPKKKIKKSKKKASFHRGSRRARKGSHGGDGGAREEPPPQEEVQRSEVDGRYCGYDLSVVPRNAWPDPKKIHLGCHSYTVLRGAGKIEVLLRNKAYFVRGPSEKKQFTWSKHGGPNSAWIAACTHAGVLP